MYEGAANAVVRLREYIGREETKEHPDGTVEIVRSGLIQRLSRFEADLRGLRDEMRRRWEALNRHDDRTTEHNVYDPSMFSQFYRVNGQPADGPGSDVLRTQLAEQFLGTLHLQSLWELPAYIERHGLDTLQRNLYGFCLERIDRPTFDVLIQHHDPAPQQEKDRHMSILTQAGPVWLKKDPELLDQQAVAAVNIVAYLATDNNNHAAYVNFRGQFAAQAGGHVQAAPGSPAAVVHYTEMAGSPLLYIDGLRDWKQRYEQGLANAEELHGDQREYKFHDILLMDPAEVYQATRGARALLLGSILRVVSMTPSPAVADQFAYVYERPQEGPRPLGDMESTALFVLTRHPDLLGDVEQDVTRMETAMDGHLRRKYCKVLEHYRDAVYPTRFYQVGNDIPEVIPVEHTAMAQESQRVWDTLLGPNPPAEGTPERQQMETALRTEIANLNLDDFTERVTNTERRVFRQEQVAHLRS